MKNVHDLITSELEMREETFGEASLASLAFIALVGVIVLGWIAFN